MKKILGLIALAAVSSAAFAQFTPGRLAVVVVGDGSAALSNAATAVSVAEFNLSGTQTNNFALPTTGTGAFTLSGTATSEGALARTSNGLGLTLGGYNAAVGTASIAGTASTAVQRSIGVLSISGTFASVNLGTTAFTTNNIRSAVSDGTNAWAVGANTGVVLNDGTVVSNSVANSRVANIFGGQLWFTTGSGTPGLYQVGTGTPTTGGNTSTLVFATGAGSSPYAFAANFSGTPTVYIADDRAGGAGGIQKWTNTGGTWSLAYTLGVGGATAPVGARGLAVDFASSTLYATTTDNRLISIVDGGPTSTFSTLATAGTNTVFRGVAFTPVPEPMTMGVLALAALAAKRKRRNKKS